MYIFNDSKFRLKVNMYGGQGSGGGIGGSGGYGSGYGSNSYQSDWDAINREISRGRTNTGGTGNQQRTFDPFSGWGVWDRFGAGSFLGSILGPVGSLVGGTLAAGTSFADPGGSVDAPLGSVDSGGEPIGVAPGSGSGRGSETVRQIEEALAAPVAPEPVAPTPPIAPSIQVAARKRKRIGRQETILTSRGSLSDTSTSKPTLLGQ